MGSDCPGLSQGSGAGADGSGISQPSSRAGLTGALSASSSPASSQMPWQLGQRSIAHRVGILTSLVPHAGQRAGSLEQVAHFTSARDTGCPARRQRPGRCSAIRRNGLTEGPPGSASSFRRSTQVPPQRGQRECSRGWRSQIGQFIVLIFPRIGRSRSLAASDASR
jgi:hypothetical protein